MEFKMKNNYFGTCRETGEYDIVIRMKPIGGLLAGLFSVGVFIG
jgi:hypothetical protein